MTKQILTFLFLFFLISSCGGNEKTDDEEIPVEPDNKPLISLLIPNTGSIGDDVQIIGKNFEADLNSVHITFGDIASSIKSVTEDKIIVTVPDNKGTVEVRVKVKDQHSNAVKFTYKEPEQKWRILKNGMYAPSNVEDAFHFKGVAIIRMKNGNIFTISSQNASISTDDGESWTNYPIADQSKFSIGSAECIETKDGVIIVAFYNVKERKWTWSNALFDAPGAILPTYVVRSTDGGKTWLEPQLLHTEWTGAIRSIIETKAGTIVFTSMKLLHNPGRHGVLTYSSTDNGVTWTASNILDNPTCKGHHAGLMESSVIQLNDGRLWQLIRTNWDYIYESFSSDEGVTWSEPKKTAIDASSSPHSIIRLKSGRLVLVWNRLYPEGTTKTPRYGGDKDPYLCETPASWMRHQLSIMFSDDDGKTWSTPRIIAKYNDYVQPENDTDSSKWISYCHAVEIDPGIILITTESGGLKITIKETDFL
ncbi:MAG: exo-alpha-sialidase [Fermentimonas sp.]|jgi:sialidase-1